jgi:NAD(P)-dependent dehydrogenase (short-subunit alcohol dehydrogenase family)
MTSITSLMLFPLCLRVDSLDLLYLNAGIMPVTGYNWGVLLGSILRCSLLWFFETGRSHAASAHFLTGPLWGHDRTATGAPIVLATHVFGHAMLAEELLPLLRAGSTGTAGEAGRIIWSASRAAAIAHVSWEAIAPPFIGDASAGDSVAVDGAHTESYGEAKCIADLLNVAMGRRLEELQREGASRKGRGVSSIAVCPGFVDTDMTPGFTAALLPVLLPLRPIANGFNVTPRRGTAVHLAVATLPAAELSPSNKYVLLNGDLGVAIKGATISTEATVARAQGLVANWLRFWRTRAGLPEPLPEQALFPVRRAGRK